VPRGPHPGDPTPVIGYIRVSTWNEEKISDEIQKSIIEDAARRAGRRIAGWIIDLDATGRNFKRRIMEAIEAVESRSMHGAREIWVWKFSRFGRSRYGVAMNLARVEHVGGQLISATEQIDTTTATGRFTRGMLFEVAAFESERAGEQWCETHEWRRRNGLPATGGHRFGYLWKPRLDPLGTPQEECYDPIEEPGDALDDAYVRYVEGEGYYPLAVDLNGMGLYNPHKRCKGPWSAQSLQQYMDSGFGAGMLHVHQRDVVCGSRQQCPQKKEHYHYIPGAHPPVIKSEETWLAYLERRAQRKKLPPRSRIPTYPLTNRMRCDLCGGASTACMANGVLGGAWRCARRVSAAKSCPGSYVTTRRVMADLWIWLDGVEAQVDAMAAGRRAECAPVKQPDTSAARARLSQQIQAAEMALDLKKKLKAEQLQAEGKLLELAAREPQVPGCPTEAHAAVVRQLRAEWVLMSVQGKHDLLGKVIREVRISPAGVEPRCNFVPVWAN
jgi:site-specific DNA recombinase